MPDRTELSVAWVLGSPKSMLGWNAMLSWERTQARRLLSRLLAEDSTFELGLPTRRELRAIVGALVREHKSADQPCDLIESADGFQSMEVLQGEIATAGGKANRSNDRPVSHIRPASTLDASAASLPHAPPLQRNTTARQLPYARGGVLSRASPQPGLSTRGSGRSSSCCTNHLLPKPRAVSQALVA